MAGQAGSDSAAHQPLTMQLSQSAWTEQSAAARHGGERERRDAREEVGRLAFADVEAVEREVHGGDRADDWQLAVADCERRASRSAVWADDESILSKAEKRNTE